MPNRRLSFAKIVKGECNSKWKNKVFTDFDIAEPHPVLFKDSERREQRQAKRYFSFQRWLCRTASYYILRSPEQQTTTAASRDCCPRMRPLSYLYALANGGLELHCVEILVHEHAVSRLQVECEAALCLEADGHQFAITLDIRFLSQIDERRVESLLPAGV